ncbi:Predicted metal-dependent hydrolase, TIM-barrel fold [Nakamurella panacisegetis]|uniref:Predicted metal-dependent hydrolase, TIM-barrel fold n=1 Tax=Nakamurella panacisegetis TaxID=1090615 RepID=A0A1H0LH47_9ACTN|nr:amidohydrolase family protein [Nakamurella panacisegetis]SDO67547.1 Predicted metal-dependent hydrolase, TIM-barrel fold [Nakamurella panacisegetis]
MSTTADEAATGVRPRVVDAHHHCYADDLPGAAGMPRYDLADLAADVRAAGVELVGDVHIEAGRGPAWSLAETDRWRPGHQQDGIHTVLVASVQLERPDLDAALDRQQECPDVVGVRQMLDWHRGVKAASPLLLDPVWRHGLASLAGRGLSFDLQVLPTQLRDATAVVAATPDVQFVLNHGGLHVPWHQADLVRWAADLLELGRLENVSVKTSGFETVDPTWDDRQFRHYLSVLLDCFGPDRTLFASNFPIDKATIDYRRLVEFHLLALDRFTIAGRDNVLCRNACRIYRIKE